MHEFEHFFLFSFLSYTQKYDCMVTVITFISHYGMKEQMLGTVDREQCIENCHFLAQIEHVTRRNHSCNKIN